MISWTQSSVNSFLWVTNSGICVQCGSRGGGAISESYQHCGRHLAWARQAKPKPCPTCGALAIANGTTPAFDGDAAKIEPEPSLAWLGSGLGELFKYGAHQLRWDARAFIVDGHYYVGCIRCDTDCHCRTYGAIP